MKAKKRILRTAGMTISLILLTGGLSGCAWLGDLLDHQEPKPTSATIYAASVEAFTICTPNNRYCDPNQAVGPPNEIPVSLGGKGGYIIATMSSVFTNGPGTDLRIYEKGRYYGGEDEPFDVFISIDGISWIQVADNIKNDVGQIYASIDITPHEEAYRFVKIVDESRSTASTGPGADIDAIEALWAP